MLNINQLNKLAKTIPFNKEKDIKIAILGDTATQILTNALRGYAFSQNLCVDIYESEYNQILPEIINPNSGLYEFNPDYIVIYMSSEMLYTEYCKQPFSDKIMFAENNLYKIVEQWNKIESLLKTRIIQFNFVENDDSCFGNFGNKVEESYIYQLRKLNYLLMEKSASSKNVYIADLSTIQNRFGRKVLFHDKYYYSARLAISMDIVPYVVKQIIDIIKSLMGKGKKCIICDLDNTLWGGVIGDDGLDKIQIGELGVGRAFSDLQQWLKELKNRGVLLAVCSKNNEDIAKEPFEKHPDMILHMDDFAIFVANWNDKASNIKLIQKTLNIGMDSLVFIDDNPFERNLVKEMIPEITVPELPEDPSLYLTFLKNENLFETSSYSKADADRTSQYQAEAKRVTFQSNFESIDSYLESLDMIGVAKPFDSFTIPRISQLTQRSNQFNLRTIRYTEGEIKDISTSDEYITIYFTLKDKFGDYGLISVVILEKKETSLFINTWLMSCRVLKRTVEEFIINKIIETAKNNGFDKVIGEYIPTPKNSMVKDIYEKMGFNRISENKFEALVDSFKYKTCFIKEDK